MLIWKNTESPPLESARRFPLGAVLLSGVCLIWGLVPGSSRAGATAVALPHGGAPFGVRGAYLQLVEGVYLLSARLHIPLDEPLRAVIKDGVALELELQIKVIRQRGYWWDEEIAALLQRYQLRYHAVSDRYLVRNLNIGEQQSFPTLEAALEELTQVRRLPVLDRTLIREDREYEAHMRATIDIGGVPVALRWLMFWADYGRRVSDWYSWRVIH